MLPAANARAVVRQDTTASLTKWMHRTFFLLVLLYIYHQQVEATQQRKMVPFRAVGAPK